MVSIAPETTVGQALDYVRDYIKRALSSEVLEKPSRETAGGHYESLISLHDAHSLNGLAGAKEAWATVKRLRPALAEFDPVAPESMYKPDDDTISIELARQLGSEAAYFHSQWKVYRNGVWETRKVNKFRNDIRHELRHWRGRGVVVSQNRIKSLASMLEDDLLIEDDEIMERQKEQGTYIPLKNGLFNLKTFTLEAHRPDLYFTTQLDFEYDPTATTKHLAPYLNMSLVYPDGKPDEQLHRLALEALGYSMTARTDMKSSFWLVGEKDSGKSTFITLLRSLLGNLHTTIDLGQLGDNKFLLSGVIGKRAITCTELSSSKPLPEAIYKQLVGGSDEIMADVKNKDPITFKPECKVWWGMNEMPRVNDRSGATIRRIIIIPFNRTVPEDKRIFDLDQKLAGERSGIFNIVIRHLKDLTEIGSFTFSQQSSARRDDYVLENDTEATYIEERCIEREDFQIQSSALYYDYKLWCENYGFKPKSFNQIAKECRRLHFTDRKSDGVKVWSGLRLRDGI